jgi:hypothetical protein
MRHCLFTAMVPQGIGQMTKLLANFRKNPTPDNARKVAAWDRKHPMAACLLDAHDQATLAYCKSAA